MKNLSVGKKILAGFMVVILMIGVILAMTVITSITRNNDLAVVNEMSQMERKANDLLYTFNLARIEIRTLFTSIDAEEEYDLALVYLEECEGILDELGAMSGRLNGYMADDLTTLRTMFGNIRSAVVNVGANDQAAAEAIATMLDNGTLMMDGAAELYTLLMELITGMEASNPGSEIERMKNVLYPAKLLSDSIATVRLESRVLMFNQDLNSIPALRENIAGVEEQMVGLYDALTTDNARAAVDQLGQAINGFSDSIEIVEEVLIQSETEIAAARLIFDDLNTVVRTNVEAITQNVLNLNSGAISSSLFAMYIMIAISAIAVVFAVIVATAIGRIITRPLNKMKALMLQAGESGDLEFSEEMRADIAREAQAKDEIGQSLLAFSKFIDHISNMSSLLASISNNDLTVDVQLLSERDTMGTAMKNMTDNLNTMFMEIKSISAQVAAAAGEIAIGAQALAQGSTEQAATVDEIRSSVNEINDQMNTSSETASEAAEESIKINHAAEIGNDKMNQMMGSMQEINNASQSIGNVIKVIDDIAFQTNILALNAAVEAARAGAHGKGFAVVAEEVRNLAGKSAEAAKETAALISMNVEKTEQGLSFTEETAASLVEIIEGIKKSQESLQQVAQQSEASKTATAQVNLAIGQVAEVVQQNSATSQESAAASEEMSSQAQVLEDIIASFKLKGMISPVQQLPPASEEYPPETAERGNGEKYEGFGKF